MGDIEFANNKDLLIVSMFSKRETGYATYYIDNAESLGNTYDVIYFERYGLDYVPEDNELIFASDCPTGGNKLKKLIPMIEYARFVRKILKRNNYCKVIILTTVPAIMLIDILLRNYQAKFLLDIRDYTYENISLYRKLEKRLVTASFATILSSRRFLDFLPASQKYYITHNIVKNTDLAERKEFFLDEIIHIGFVGSVRYYDVNVRLCKQFGQQTRFHLDYYGTVTNDCDLQTYCNSNQIHNVTFHGQFENTNKPEIYKHIDVINGVYDTTMIETLNAIPNRFYDAALYSCPIMVSKNTYLAELVEEYDIGFAVDIETESIVDALDDYITHFDMFRFKAGRHRLLQEVSSDMVRYEAMISSFLTGDRYMWS